MHGLLGLMCFCNRVLVMFAGALVNSSIKGKKILVQSVLE